MLRKIGSVKDEPATEIIGTGSFKVDKLHFSASIAPGLDANLLSGGKLVREGYSAVLKKNLEPGVDFQIIHGEEL